VVRSKCGLSSTLIMAPRAWMRSMMCTPSLIDRVARSHSATTRTSSVPGASIAWIVLDYLPRPVTLPVAWAGVDRRQAERCDAWRYAPPRRPCVAKCAADG
jgi:hypothetical protein